MESLLAARGLCGFPKGFWPVLFVNNKKKKRMDPVELVNFETPIPSGPKDTDDDRKSSFVSLNADAEPKNTVSFRTLHKMRTEVRSKANTHTNRFNYYRRILDWHTLLHTFFSMSVVSTLLLSLTQENNEIAVLVAAVMSSVAYVTQMMVLMFKLSDRVGDEMVLAKQYSTLRQEIDVRVSRNHLTSTDISYLLEEMTSRLRLISDTETIV